MKNTIRTLLALSVVLSCGPAEEEKEPEAGPDTLPISGTIEAWTLGAGHTLKGAVCISSVCEELGSSSISDTGAFSLTLAKPTNLGVSAGNPANCNGDFAFAPDDVKRGLVSGFSVFDSTGARVGSVRETTGADVTSAPAVGDKLPFAMYADKAGTLNGTLTCTSAGGDNVTKASSLTITSGWGKYHQEFTSLSPTTTEYKAGNPGGTRFFYY